MIQARAQDPLERGVDLGQQPTQTVLGAGDLAGPVVVEAHEHVQLGNGLVVRRQVPQSVRHGAGGISDHRTVHSGCSTHGERGFDGGLPREEGGAAGCKAERIAWYGAMRFVEYATEWKAGQRDLGPASVVHLASLLNIHLLRLLGSRRMNTFNHKLVEGFLQTTTYRASRERMSPTVRPTPESSPSVPSAGAGYPGSTPGCPTGSGCSDQMTLPSAV